MNDRVVKWAEFSKNVVEVLAIVLAAAWAVYTFWWEKMLTPSNEPPYLNITSTHTIEGEKDSFYILRSTVQVCNAGKIRTIVQAACFHLTACRIKPALAKDVQYEKAVNDYMDLVPAVPRFYDDSISVINTGKLIEEGWRMDPGEAYSRSFVSLVPKDKFDIARFYTELYVSRKADSPLPVKWQTDHTGMVTMELGSLKGKSIQNLGLGRSYNMEEIVLPAKK